MLTFRWLEPKQWWITLGSQQEKNNSNQKHVCTLSLVYEGIPSRALGEGRYCGKESRTDDTKSKRRTMGRRFRWGERWRVEQGKGAGRDINTKDVWKGHMQTHLFTGFIEETDRQTEREIHIKEFHWVTYTRDNTHPRRHSLPNKNSSAKCGIPPLKLLVRGVPRDPPNNTGYYHCSWLPTRTWWTLIAKDTTCFDHRTRRHQARWPGVFLYGDQLSQ